MEDGLFFGFIVGVILFFAFLIGSEAGNQARFNTWLTRCQNDQGVVQKTHEGFFSTQYECFKDGKIIDHED